MYPGTPYAAVFSTAFGVLCPRATKLNSKYRYPPTQRNTNTHYQTSHRCKWQQSSTARSIPSTSNSLRIYFWIQLLSLWGPDHDPVILPPPQQPTKSGNQPGTNSQHTRNKALFGPHARKTNNNKEKRILM